MHQCKLDLKVAVRKAALSRSIFRACKKSVMILVLQYAIVTLTELKWPATICAMAFRNTAGPPATKSYLVTCPIKGRMTFGTMHGIVAESLKHGVHQGVPAVCLASAMLLQPISPPTTASLTSLLQRAERIGPHRMTQVDVSSSGYSVISYKGIEHTEATSAISRVMF